MFLKRIVKRNKTDGLEKINYRLCESYRFDNTVRHETILHVGALEELPDVEQKRSFLIRIEELIKQSNTGGQSLFMPDDLQVELLAQHFFKLILEKQRIDIAEGKEYHRIDTDTVKNKNIREAGTEWLCMQALKQLNIAEFLRQQGWEETSINLAFSHVISRASYPASELRTSQWIKKNSAVCEITGYPADQITKDKLYSISHRLYKLKDNLEKHLSTRTNELFDLHDKLIIYDLTNTYFEGSMRHSKIARFGRSKEKRNDAKLIVLAVVVNAEGFLKYSQIFEGNISDNKTLGKIIDQLSSRTSSIQRRPIVVLDAGIATEENLKVLRQKGFEYMCVSRSNKKRYIIDTNCNPVEITDKKKQSLTLQKINVEGSSDSWLRVHSHSKALKETAMNTRFSKRFEQGLLQIKESISKKGGVKKQQKVWERIGKLKAKYPGTNSHYEIKADSNDKGIVTNITWQQKAVQKNEGHYLLRTTLDQKEEQTQWRIYNTIREIESTFRVLKTDLDLRPIYHKTDAAAMAHLHLGLLAYWVVNTIRYQLKQKGIHNEWRDIVRIMNTQKIITTTMQTQYEQHIIIRQCSEPNQEVKTIYAALNYKEQPFTRKKSVVPPPEIQKSQSVDTLAFLSG
ncbi:MAG: IS1634 family transposase [Segetibacter sp.]